MAGIDPVDHLAVALGRLPAYLRDKPRWRELLTVLMAPVQEIEDAVQELIRQRHLDNAEGAQLEQLGRLVGEPPIGLDDPAYRRRIRVRIARNRSQVLVEDVIKIARLAIYDAAATITVERQDVATVVVRVGAAAVDSAVADDLIAFLRGSVGAGVRVLVEYSEAAPATTFTFDGPAGLGFPSPHTIRLENYWGGPATDLILGVRPEVDATTALGLTFEIIDGGGIAAAGTLDDTGPALSFTFRSDFPPSTTADLEAAIATSTNLYVVTPSATVENLTAPDSEIGPTSVTADGALAAGGALAGLLE